MLTVGTLLFQWNDSVPDFARCYTPEWVDKLYRGILFHYTKPFRFVCLVDKEYDFQENIEMEMLQSKRWGVCDTQMYGIKGDRLALFGLDTIITGSLDSIFAYDGPLAVPRDPYNPMSPCNGVVLCPSRPEISAQGGNGMAVLRHFDHEYLDDLFPGLLKSYKVHVVPEGLGDARIVYFHGEPKPHILKDAWIKENWI